MAVIPPYQTVVSADSTARSPDTYPCQAPLVKKAGTAGRGVTGNRAGKIGNSATATATSHGIPQRYPRPASTEKASSTATTGTTTSPSRIGTTLSKSGN